MIPARGMPGQYEEGVVHRFTKQWYHVIYTGQWYQREGCQVSMKKGWSTDLLNSGIMSSIQDNDTGERDARSVWRMGGPLIYLLNSGIMSSIQDNDTSERDARSVWRMGGPLIYLLNSGIMSSIQDNDTGERDARSVWRRGGPLLHWYTVVSCHLYRTMIPARGMPGQYEEVVHCFTKQWYHVIYTGQWHRREGCQVSMKKGWSTDLLNSGTMSSIQDNDTSERDARSVWRRGGPPIY